MKLKMLLLIIWNVLVLFLYGADKLRAKRNMWRISENVLLFLMFCMGAFGALFGMLFFNHKTSKIKFKVLMPVAMIFNIAMLFVFLN